MEEGGDSVSNIFVAVRVRPLNKAELESNSKETIQVVNENALIFDPITEEIAMEQRRNGNRKALANNYKATKNKSYRFDRVFATSSRQEEIYQAIQKMIPPVLDGYNGTIFSYGNTGSGLIFALFFI